MHYRAPSGVLAGAHLPNGPYKSTDGALVVAWRSHHWYTWFFGVKAQSVGPSPNASALLFGAGGNQGGEGSDSADEWCVDPPSSLPCPLVRREWQQGRRGVRLS